MKRSLSLQGMRLSKKAVAEEEEEVEKEMFLAILSAFYVC